MTILKSLHFRFRKATVAVRLCVYLCLFPVSSGHCTEDFLPDVMRLPGVGVVSRQEDMRAEERDRTFPESFVGKTVYPHSVII
jgi:hypothetical protein